MLQIESLSENNLKTVVDAQRIAPEKANAERKAEEATKPPTIFQDTLKDGTLGPAMVWIPTGQFRMGDLTDKGEKDELPVHTVNITQAFAIGQYEVTFDEYDKFAKATQRKLPDDKGWGRGKRPVINISWNDAVAYAQWLSVQTGKPYRLPTEAEWEFAARAGTETDYWWGNELGKNRANCDGCGSQWDNKQTAPVGSFPANAWGLYDTAGNVWEWAQDCYHDNYKGSPTDGTAWQQDECANRVLRGGSWSSSGRIVRSAYRGRLEPGGRNLFIGFRLALGQTGQ
ncbi:MAG: formylglycine-generating enzyme family protein [Candidatus Methylumidiphilus sp.]